MLVTKTPLHFTAVPPLLLGLKNAISEQSLLTCLQGFPASQSGTRRAKVNVARACKLESDSWTRDLEGKDQETKTPTQS